MYRNKVTRRNHYKRIQVPEGRNESRSNLLQRAVSTALSIVNTICKCMKKNKKKTDLPFFGGKKIYLPQQHRLKQVEWAHKGIQNTRIRS